MMTLCMQTRCLVPNIECFLCVSLIKYGIKLLLRTCVLIFCAHAYDESCSAKYYAKENIKLDKGLTCRIIVILQVYNTRHRGFMSLATFVIVYPPRCRGLRTLKSCEYALSFIQGSICITKNFKSVMAW